MNIEKINTIGNRIIGEDILYYPEISSTQDEAKKRINDLENGTVIITDNQTKGRGTKGRTWHTSYEKNIAMSIVLKLDCIIDKLDGLTINIAEVIKESIYDLFKYKLDIKVPNDVILNGKKIAGIIIETKTLEKNVKYVIIGIGFNVNETTFTEETINIATSLKKEFNKEFDIERIIEKFLFEIDKLIISKQKMF